MIDPKTGKEYEIPIADFSEVEARFIASFGINKSKEAFYNHFYGGRNMYRFSSHQPLAENTKRPPLGIEPNKMWKEQRCQSLKCAIDRYLVAGLAFPLEWAEEYNQLKEELQ